MIFILTMLLALNLLVIIQTVGRMRTVGLARQNLNNIYYLVSHGIINDIQYKVYMNEFEDFGWKDHMAMVNLAQELREIHDVDE